MIRPRIVALVALASALALTAIAFAKTTTHTTSVKGKAGATAHRTTSKKAGGDLIARGRMLAMIGGCNDCHTPGTLFGAPDFSRQLSGSELGWNGPWGTSYGRNLTPDMETGLGYYSEKEITDALRSGHRLDGKPMLPPMPWQNLTAMSDADMRALVAFLKSLPPVSHKVPDALPPGSTPTTGAYVSFPPPPAWDAPRTSTPVDKK